MIEVDRLEPSRSHELYQSKCAVWAYQHAQCDQSVSASVHADLWDRSERLDQLQHDVGKTHQNEVRQNRLGHAGLTSSQAQDLFAISEETFDGLITNDKFCMSRTGRLMLRWW